MQVGNLDFKLLKDITKSLSVQLYIDAMLEQIIELENTELVSSFHILKFTDMIDFYISCVEDLEGNMPSEDLNNKKNLKILLNLKEYLNSFLNNRQVELSTNAVDYNLIEYLINKIHSNDAVHKERIKIYLLKNTIELKELTDSVLAQQIVKFIDEIDQLIIIQPMHLFMDELNSLANNNEKIQLNNVIEILTEIKTILEVSIKDKINKLEWIFTKE